MEKKYGPPGSFKPIPKNSILFLLRNNVCGEEKFIEIKEENIFDMEN